MEHLYRQLYSYSIKFCNYMIEYKNNNEIIMLVSLIIADLQNNNFRALNILQHSNNQSMEP